MKVRILVVLLFATFLAAAPAAAQGVPACDDGVDNDADGHVDLDDPGCLGSRIDSDETDPAPVPSTFELTTARPYACGVETGVEVLPDLRPKRLFPFSDVRIEVRGVGGRARGIHKTRDLPVAIDNGYLFARLRPGRYRVTGRYLGDPFRLASDPVTRRVRLSAGRCRTYVAGADGRRRYRPKLLVLGASQTIYDVSWQRWGQRAARGTGTYPANDCIPYCAAGTITRHPVTVRLSRPRVCGGYTQFLMMRWTYRGTRPAGAPRTERLNLDFSC
jgi:hypothetical protein